jgi:hypothetical protein
MTIGAGELIQQYYDSCPSSDLRPGKIMLGPILEFENRPWFASLDRVDPSHVRPATFTLTTNPTSQVFNHQPIKEASLEVESTEALVVFKAKKRPVVLYSMAPETWNLRTGRQADRVYLCLPSYRLEDYYPQHIAAVKCCKYVSLFYLPADSSFGRQEAMLRFDRAQMISESQLEPISPSQRLGDDALTLLTAWFRYWTTGEPEDWILQYQAEQLARISPDSPSKTP